MRTDALILAGVLAASAGCHESDVSVVLDGKGTAVLAVDVRITPRYLKGGLRLAKIDPALAILQEADPLFLRTPDEATRKELEKAGVKVLEQSSKRTETEMSSKFRVQLKRLSSLEAFARLRGGAETAGDIPEETGLHLPVDAVRLSRDAEGIYSIEGTFPTLATARIKAGAVKEDLDKFTEALGVAAELANEVNTFQLAVSMAVPGEIVDFSPADMGRIEDAKPGTVKKDGGRVFFSTRMGALSPDYLTKRKGQYIPLVYRVRFRLPKGKSLPADALWDGVPRAPKPPDAPKPADPPKDAPPPPAPPK